MNVHKKTLRYKCPATCTSKYGVVVATVHISILYDILHTTFASTLVAQETGEINLMVSELMSTPRSAMTDI